MFSDLIIGFDGSASARDALALARRLALPTGARPTVIYVRPYTALSAEPFDGTPDEGDLTWEAEVSRVLDEARALIGDVPGASFQASPGPSVARALHISAEDADAALIVLGATHRSGLGRVVPGATAEAVIHAAPCAVAIAPAGYAQRAARRPFGLIAAALDGGPESRRVARVAARIARDADAALRLIAVPGLPAMCMGWHGYVTTIDTMRDLAADTLKRAADAAGPHLTVERCVANAPVVDGVSRHSESADLLVIGSRGYGPLRRVVLGTHTGPIMHAARIPVLVVPRGAAEELDEAMVPVAAASAR
jgi:nucleotide-binding universal stress UspA family protein